METFNITKRIFAFWISIVLISVFTFTVFAQDDEEKTNVIRVGAMISPGMLEVDTNGNYSGYTYDYLQEIAQYTGWDYEFVEASGDSNESILKLMDMLENGEIDLLGGLVYSDELAKSYDYSGYSYGTAYTTLSVHENNTDINETNYASLRNMRVALPKTSTIRKNELMQFCEMNNITPKLVYCEDETDLLNSVYDGRADAILNRDLNVYPNMRIIAKFAPQYFYFATTKGNYQIVSALNSAIVKVNEADPYFSVKLHEEYFGNKTSILYLTEDEIEYLKAIDTIRVASTFSKEPFLYYDEKTEKIKGITNDILEHITKETGLQFSYIHAKNQDDLKSILKSGQADIAPAMLYDYETANKYGVGLSRPYISTQVVMATKDGANLDDMQGKVIALPKDYTALKPDGSEAVYYETVEECLEAVDHGTVDLCLADGYSLQYLINNSYYQNISLVPQTIQTDNICIGIAKPVDRNLLTILNKVIINIPKNELQTFIYRNTVNSPSAITISSFILSDPKRSVVLISILAFLGIFFLSIVLLYKNRAECRVKLENQRYLLLCDLSNEYIFEYDYTCDKFMLSERLSNILGCERFYDSFVEKVNNNAFAATVSLPKELIARVQQGGTEETLCTLANGTKRWFRVCAKVIFGSKGNAIYVIGKMSDIQNEKHEMETLLEKSRKDSLTDIYNAQSAKMMIAQYLKEQKADMQSALFIIDIDHFKNINDQFGHYTGDRVLAEISGILQSIFRKDDIVGRLGGDEFVVLMKGISGKEDAVSKCLLLRKRVLNLKSMPLGQPVTLSIGVSVTADSQSFDILYKIADEALYKVKNNSRDGAEII